MVQETINLLQFITFLFQAKLNMRYQKKKGKESPFSNQRTLCGDDVKNDYICLSTKRQTDQVWLGSNKTF